MPDEKTDAENIAELVAWVRENFDPYPDRCYAAATTTNVDVDGNIVPVHRVWHKRFGDCCGLRCGSQPCVCEQWPPLEIGEG
jgi:hypothetical protein